MWPPLDDAAPPELVIVVPSRGRPHAVAELRLEFTATCTARTALLPVVDADDATRNEYPAETWVSPGRTMVQALNWAAARLVSSRGRHSPPFAIGFMGDDHRPITRGWDSAYLASLRDLVDARGAGIVYGNDLLQGSRLPTQVAMTSNIPRQLSYMAPPQFGHLFVDNVWKAWGERADCLRYLPDVIVEHRHPVALKAEWDEGYRRVNSDRRQRADRQHWADYQGTQLTVDAAAIRRLRGADA